MQYKVGTVTTNGTNQVTGSGTAWATNAAIGDLFWIQGQNAPYYIGNVNSDGLITLTSVFAGPNASGQNYVIARSFTANQKFPYPESTDIDTHTIVKRAMTMLDTMVGAAIGAAGQANRVVFTDANGNLSTHANLAYSAGGNLRVGAGSGASLGGAGCVDVTADIGMTSTNGIIVGGTRIISFASNSVTLANALITAGGSAGSPTVTFSGDTDTGIFNAASNGVSFAGAGAEQVRINGTASATRYLTLTGSNGGTPTISTNAGGPFILSPDTDAVYFGTNGGSVQAKVLHTASANRQVTLTGSNGGDPVIGSTAGDVLFTSGSGTTRTYAAAARHIVQSTTGTNDALVNFANTAGNAYVGIDSSGGGLGGQYTLNLWHGGNYPIVFATNNAEKGRFTSGGYFKANAGGTYQDASGKHELDQSSSDFVELMYNSHATNPNGLRVSFGSAPNNGTAQFLSLIDTGATRGTWDSNGGIRNFSANNVNLSDGTIKVGMVAAPDYCEFIEKASSLLKVGAYEDDPARRVHTMFDSREVEQLDASLISPWQHTPMMVLKGLSEHEIQMRHLGATGALLRRMKVVEQRLGIS